MSEPSARRRRRRREPPPPPIEHAAVQLGLDENGLGAMLGPMVVTAVRLEVDTNRVPDARALARVARRAGIDDSKAACAHGAMAEVEGQVLALLDVHLAGAHASLASLMRAHSLDDEPAQRRHCPDAGDAPVACFADPIALPAFGAGSTDAHRRVAHALLDAGVRCTGVRTALDCARSINRARAAGRSRFDVDLGRMVDLAMALRGADDVSARCGKVGGRKSYAPALERVAPLIGVLHESQALSSYRVPGLGQVHFVMDGDASEPAISLASLVGKYVRELWTHRLNRYWQSAAPGVADASGYHDPVTLGLVAATALVRRERAIPDDCFAR